MFSRCVCHRNIEPSMKDCCCNLWIYGYNRTISVYDTWHHFWNDHQLIQWLKKIWGNFLKKVKISQSRNRSNVVNKLQIRRISTDNDLALAWLLPLSAFNCSRKSLRIFEKNSENNPIGLTFIASTVLIGSVYDISKYNRASPMARSLKRNVSESIVYFRRKLIRAAGNIIGHYEK